MARSASITACARCPRLRRHCREVARTRRRAYRDETYWGRPVPSFGDPDARVLVVGLAPAAHGANRTGRMFTGDRSGEWLYRALHDAGFSNQPESTHARDGLRLDGVLISAVVHCAPPDNKPTPSEIENCRPWLQRELLGLKRLTVVIALGQIAWTALWKELVRIHGLRGPRPRFGHGVEFQVPGGPLVLLSYHPSQQNTFTGRLTRKMFDSVFQRAREALTLSPSA